MQPPPSDWVPNAIPGIDPDTMAAWVPPANEAERIAKLEEAARLAWGFFDHPDGGTDTQAREAYASLDALFRERSNG